MNRPPLPTLSAAALVALLLLPSTPLEGGEPGPGPDAPSLFRFRDREEAGRRWKPMTGSPPVTPTVEEGRPGLRLDIPFGERALDRASWDADVQLDLSDAVGVRFRMKCPDPSPVSHFTVYFASDRGWYAATPSGWGTDRWGEVFVEKAAARIEGRVAGWRRIHRLRISAWRGAGENGSFFLSGFEVARANGPVTVVRGESTALRSETEGKEAHDFAGSLFRHLGALGLDPRITSDLDLEGADLGRTGLLVFPLNPSLPEDAEKRVRAFLERGGKALFFYAIPGGLAGPVGIRRGRYVRQEYPGQFAVIRIRAASWPGVPREVGQRSWNIQEGEAVEGRSEVWAEWADETGKATGRAALVKSDNAFYMSHVLLDDDPGNKRRLLLGMVGAFVPGAWRSAAAHAIERIGAFGPFTGLDGVRRELEPLLAGSPEGAGELASAGALGQLAEELSRKGLFAEAMDAARGARQAAIDAYCSSRRPQAGEHRAFWCHDAWGVEGASWDAAVKALAENGFTAVLPNMLWAGAAFYDSKVLPVSPEVKKRGSALRACLEACRRHGVECHVWKVNWNLGRHAPASFAKKMEADRRVQVASDGSPRSGWLCPSHPANRELEVASMLEVARTFEVDGLHFDYIRYPSERYCFCAGCRKRFEEAVGEVVPRWPRDVLAQGPLRRLWLDFRRRNITAVVEAVSAEARRIRPGIRISAAVFANWPVDRDRIGQDWKLWCEKGYLDFVCPMDYTPDGGRFRSWVRRQKEWAGKVPCYPGIGLSTWADRGDVCSVLEQIEMTRASGTGGFTVFNLGDRELHEVLPRLGKGMTRK